MRELNTHETDQAGGGIIVVDKKGNVMSSSGTTTIVNGIITIKTDDGWEYCGDSAGNNWIVSNEKGETVDSALDRWLDSMILMPTFG